jgi:acetolactate synthase I/II/III large subunit
MMEASRVPTEQVDARIPNHIDGGTSVVKWLKRAGVENVFSVSGGPINPIYRACADQKLSLVHTRHEAAACFMAEAFSRVTGKAGAVVVTLGPGVTNTVTPAMVATMAGTPLIIIGAQAATKSFERGAGMSYDVLPTLQTVTKWSGRVLDVTRIHEYLDIAWRKMWAGRPGPVFLEVPADVLSTIIDIDAEMSTTIAPPQPAKPGVSTSVAADLLEAFTKTTRPLLLIGDEAFWDRSDRMIEAIERHGIPFSTLRLARGIVDEHHELWAGPGYAPCNSALRRALKESDCIIVLGHHFEFDLEFGDNLGSETRVIQICSDSELLHRNRRADIAVAASPSSFISVLADAPTMTIDRSWVQSILGDWTTEREAQSGENTTDGLHPVAAIDAVSQAAPDNTIFVSSHGNVDFWADARLRISAPGRYLRAGQSGALGAEVPYGAGASFADPDSPVVVFVGDGGVGYHVAELDTAERHGRALIIVVLDDQMWGAIALPQEARFGETFAMDLPRRDWRKVAEALGCGGYFCRDAAEIKAALGGAISSKKPALIHIPVRSVISPYMAYIS